MLQDAGLGHSELRRQLGWCWNCKAGRTGNCLIESVNHKLGAFGIHRQVLPTKYAERVFWHPFWHRVNDYELEASLGMKLMTSSSCWYSGKRNKSEEKAWQSMIMTDIKNRLFEPINASWVTPQVPDRQRTKFLSSCPSGLVSTKWCRDKVCATSSRRDQGPYESATSSEEAQKSWPCGRVRIQIIETMFKVDQPFREHHEAESLKSNNNNSTIINVIVIVEFKNPTITIQQLLLLLLLLNSKIQQ